MLRSLAGQPQLTPTLEEMQQLHAEGISYDAILRPQMPDIALGCRRGDGFLEHDYELGAARWLAIDEGFDPQSGLALDTVYFQIPRPHVVATETGRAFALGQDQIDNAASYALDDWLRIHDTPLDWLRANRRGIYVLNWRLAFDRLRWAPRLEMSEATYRRYENNMQPLRLPDVRIFRSKGRRP